MRCSEASSLLFLPPPRRGSHPGPTSSRVDWKIRLRIPTHSTTFARLRPKSRAPPLPSKSIWIFSCAPPNKHKRLRSIRLKSAPIKAFGPYLAVSRQAPLLVRETQPSLTLGTSDGRLPWLVALCRHTRRQAKARRSAHPRKEAARQAQWEQGSKPRWAPAPCAS